MYKNVTIDILGCREHLLSANTMSLYTQLLFLSISVDNVSLQSFMSSEESFRYEEGRGYHSGKGLNLSTAEAFGACACGKIASLVAHSPSIEGSTYKPPFMDLQQVERIVTADQGIRD